MYVRDWCFQDVGSAFLHSNKYLKTPMISEYTGNFLGSLNLGIAGKLISGSNSSPDDLVLLFVLTDAMLCIQSESC